MSDQTVLVIDPHSAIHAITALALGQSECRVEQVADAPLAYDSVRTVHPQVILCTADAPGLDLEEFGNFVRTHHRQTALILIASSETTPEEVRRAEAAGFARVLRKPFKSTQLRELVEELLIAPGQAPNSTPEAHTGGSERVLLMGLSPLVEAVLHEMLETFGLVPVAFDGKSALHSSGTFAQWNPEGDLSWYIPAEMGPLVLITTKQHYPLAQKAVPDALLLIEPLTERTVALLLTGLFAKELPSSPNLQRPLTAQERYDRAATLARRIFERMLAAGPQEADALARSLEHSLPPDGDLTKSAK